MSSSLSGSIAEVAAMSDLAFRKRFRSSYESSPSSSPPDLPSRKRYREDEGPAAGDEGPNAWDEGLAAGDEGSGMRVESLSFGEDEDVFKGQSSGTRLWRQPSGFWIVPDLRGPRESSPPVQTPHLLKWSAGSLPVSPGTFYVSLPISSPIIPLTVPSLVASPATAETEGFLTEFGAQVEMQGGLIHDHTGQSRMRSSPRDIDLGVLEHEQERVAVTFGAIWRPVLA
ncbi:hypothetical protein Tco_0655634 [Tanacetum coccineum]|uniref:Uncharacterized protein n=1 Tax=Tanacetum coccineum TaxID=301880 RepID=A0ABQ4X7M8_9ASTR